MKLPEPRYQVSDINHKYTISLPNGETVGPLKSVTSVLNVLAKEALIGWAAREAAGYFKTEILRMGRSAFDPAMLDQITKDAAGAHRRRAKDAADLGTKCHDVFEAIIRGREPEALPSELVEPTAAFKTYCVFRTKPRAISEQAEGHVGASRGACRSKARGVSDQAEGYHSGLKT